MRNASNTMDPDHIIEQIREFIADWDECDGDGMENSFDDFVTLVEGLDKWLSKKGALPEVWKR